MRILVTSGVDPTRSAPNRLHHLTAHLSRDHFVEVIAPSEHWKPLRASTDRYYTDWTPLGNAKVTHYESGYRSRFLQDLSYSVRARRFLDSNWDIHLNYNALWPGYLNTRILASKNVPTILDLADHLPALIRKSERVPIPLRPLASSMASHIVRRSQRASVLTTYSSKGLKDHLVGCIGGSEFVPNGVELQHFKLVNPTLQPDDLAVVRRSPQEFILGFVGSLREWVDLGKVMNAIKLIRKEGVPARLVVVGEESQHAKLLRLARDLGVRDHIQCHRVVPYRTIPSIIMQFDVGLIPFYQDDIALSSFPLKLLEYMALKVPVVATPLGLPEDLRRLVIEVRSVADYVESFKRIFGGDDSIDDLVHKAYARVLNRYTWSAIASRLGNLLERVAEESPRNA